MLDHQLYFTFSSVDMHWPELHALFGGENDRTAEHRHQNVISNLHITTVFQLMLGKFYQVLVV